ncbi:MAG: ABC transporter ATP-binding protein [Burkholderiales bacterium]
MSDALLEVQGICKRFGGFSALNEVGFTLGAGERFGIIGPNGSGKTTLMHCIGGTLASDGGAIRLNGVDITRQAAHRRARLGIARTFQVPRPFASLSVADNVCVALEYASGMSMRPTENLHDKALAILEQMQLRHKAQSPAGNLSQVELRKLELARALGAQPRILILDEVMAGLAAGEVDEVLEIVMRINAQGVAVIMIEHIMRAIMRFSQRVICLDAGTIIAEGVPGVIVENASVRRIYLGA